MHEEKRKHHRIKINCDLSAVYPDSSIVFLYYTENLCEGGVGIVLDKKMPVGGIVKLNIFLPEQKLAIKCEGEVRWTSKIENKDKDKVLYQTGIKFINIQEKDTENIRKLVSKFLNHG
ncbi:MAG: PilZ domain-containing protein [Candidatus Omnitrophica bacterium]|nr:PilZ domain-containing protein [Candidatus Omnitrophota bacterium]